MTEPKKNETPTPAKEKKNLGGDDAPAETTPPAAEPAPPAAESAPAPEAELQREAADVSAEIDGLKDRLLRLQADFDNFRKRTARDRAEMCVRATEDLIRELLPVLDHFEIGMKTAVEHGVDEAVRQGFQLVYDQLTGALAKFGLEPVDAAGQPFDAHAHEAVTQMPSVEIPAGTVTQQVRRGYRLGGRLLRPAQVIVSSGPPEPTAGGGEA